MKVIKVPFSCGRGEELAADIIVQKAKEYSCSEEERLPVLITDYAEAEDKIHNKAADVFKENLGAVFLGGGHLITLPIFQAFREVYPGAGIVILDAHIDSQFDEDLLNGLVKIIKGENIILVGCRKYSPRETAFIKEHKIRMFTMKEIASEGCHEVSDSVMSIAKNFSNLYVSIDIDVLDPAFAPGTGCPEPGGLSSRELIYFIQRLKKLRNFTACDITEINPKADNGITSEIGAKLLIELS